METQKHIIPPKSHVYLEGPKSRGYELAFAWRVFKLLPFISGCSGRKICIDQSYITKN